MTPEELKQKKNVLLALMSDPMYKPMRIREIAVFLDVPKSRRGELEETLNALVEEGKIRVSGRGKYGKPQRQETAGIFMANPKGFGFVRAEGMDQDVFIGRENTHGALNGDTVRISVEPGQRFRSAEGVVLEIVKHANERIVGYYRRVKNFGLVMPDDQRITQDIYIPAGKEKGAVTGHKVVARVTRFPNHRQEEPEGVVEEIIGHVNDPGTDILSIIKAYDLPDVFPPEVMKEAEQVPDRISADAAEGRKDLRDLLTITIDGEDAKDLDDAVSVRKPGQGGVPPVHQCLHGGPGAAHASAPAVQRDLFVK